MARVKIAQKGRRNAAKSRRATGKWVDPLEYYLIEGVKWKRPDDGRIITLGAGPTARRCLNSTAPFRCIIGGNRVGKTLEASIEAGAFLRGEHPVRPWYGPVRGFIVIPSKKQSAMFWGPRLLERSEILGPARNHPIIPPHMIEEKKVENTSHGKALTYLRMKNGSELYFVWAGSASQWELIEGADMDFVIRDEAASDMKMQTELLMRTMDARDDPARPLGGWFLWVATETDVEFAFMEYKNACAAAGELYHFPPMENPLRSSDQLEMTAAMMSDEEARTRIWGTSDAASERTVYLHYWDDDRNVVDPPQIEPLDNIWVVHDPAFGMNGSNHGIMLVLIKPDFPEQLIAFRWHEARNQTLRQQVTTIGTLLGGLKPEGILFDTYGNRTESDGVGVWEKYCQYLNDDKIIPHSGLGRTIGNHDHGVTKLRQMLEDGTFVVSSDIPQVIEGIKRQMTSRKDQKFSGPGGLIRDQSEAADCARYIAMQEPRWIKRESHVIRKRKEEGKDEEERLAQMTPAQIRHMQYLQMSEKNTRNLSRNKTIAVRRKRMLPTSRKPSTFP